jgi:hypothetical protein
MKYKLLRFSLLSMLVMLFGGWSQSASAADKWVKTSPSSLKSNDKVVIVDLTSSLAMSNNNGTSSAPVGVAVTLNDNKTEITSTVDNGITWFVEKDATTDGFKFAANLPASVGADPSTKYLYCTNSNNGVRVGTNTNNLFIFEEPYLKNVATSRYVGVFTTNPDWRCYSSKTEKNIKETVTAFFVLTKGEDDTRLATTIELANAPAEGIKGSSVSAPTATIRDASGAPVTQGGISWSSSNENVAYVSDPILYFVGAGTATITASFEGNTSYQPCSESFSVTVTAEPYTSFRALQADANITSVPISFTFSGQQVVFVNGKNAFLADGQGFGALVFTDGHGLVAGEKLTGTTSCNLELYQGNTEITNFDKSKLTTTTADVVPVETTLGNLSFANQSTLVTLKGLTYSDADKKLSDGTNNIIYYDKFKTNASLEDGKKYDVTGIVWIDGRASNPAPIIEICPRTAADVAEASEESSASAEDREIIKWSERDVASAGQTAKSFNSPNQKITLEITDTDGKLAVEGNNCWFGDEETQEKFTHRLKTGGKSSSKNALSMTVAEAGTLKIYVRTGSNSATDRNLVLTQDGVELFNQVIQESDAIKVKGMDSSDPDKETNVYPIISVPVAAGTVAITYPTNSLNFYAFEFVAGGEDTPEIPENAIWTSDKAEELTWGQENVAIPADKFANAKVGDIIRVHLQNVKTGAANAWDAQVGLRAQNGKDLEFLVNVAGVTGSAPAEYADFLITGDILAILQSVGARIYGNECQTALVTLEGSNYTGSAESIWIGSSTDNVAISPNHFANANNFEGVKVGDIIRVTFDTPNWLGMNYQDDSWTWSEFPAGSLEMVYDWTNPVADFVVKTEEAAAILNNTKNAQIVVNAGGQDNPKTITQVELIPGTEEEPHLYVIGDMNGWDRVNMIELGYNNDADAFEYSITVDKTFYLAFSENQMTQKEAENDRDWSNFNASYRLAPQEDNFTPTLDEQVQLIYVAGCIVLEPGTYTFYITKDLKMTVTGEATPIVEDVDYIVAGSPASVFGDEWNPVSQNNRMAKQDDGTYAITYNAVAPQENIELKVVEQGGGDPIWHGNANGGNVVFNVTSECDVTITFDPATKEITVTGDGVEFATDFEYESVYVVGNYWVNSVSWDPTAEVNKMAKVMDDVWEITYQVNANTLQDVNEFKFAIDGAWTHDFGGTFSGFNVETDAVYKGDNIKLDRSDIAGIKITVRLDLRNFDFATKEGAKFSILTENAPVAIPDIASAYKALEVGDEPIESVSINLKNAKVTLIKQTTADEFLGNIEGILEKYYEDGGAKPALFKAPKKDAESDIQFDFAIIEDETGAMPFIGCFLEENGISEGSVLNGNIEVILFNDFFPIAQGDELEEHITDKMTTQSLQALEVTDGTAGPTEITADNAEEYKANYGFRYVKFSESELTVGSSEEQRASTLKLDVIDETVDIGDFLGTGAILDEDGTVSVEGFMYEMFGAKLFQPTKMESGNTGINSVMFFENTKGTVYNLNGQRVTTPQKGVMIVNGKKVVVK